MQDKFFEYICHIGCAISLLTLHHRFRIDIGWTKFLQCGVIRVVRNFPKVLCSHCLLHWIQGIVYCTRGQCLSDSESRRKCHKLRLDAFSISNYVIEKGPILGVRHGKTEVQREYHLAWNAWKRCCKKVDSHGGLLQRYSFSISQRSSLP